MHGYWLDRLVASREAFNTALAGALLVVLAMSMTGRAQAQDVNRDLESYDREMLTSLIEAVIAVDEGDMVVTAAIPETAASAPAGQMANAGPVSIIPARRPDVVTSGVLSSPVAPIPAAAKADPGFALQLGSYVSAENAQRGFEAANTQYASVLAEHILYVQPVDLGSRGVFHRLRIGGFETLPQASGACTQLGIAAADCMIVSAAQQ